MLKQMMMGMLTLGTALTLAACGNQTSQKPSDASSQQTSESSSQAPTPLTDYVQDMDEMGLTATDSQTLDVATLPEEVHAVAAIRFNTDDGQMTLIRTKTESDATAALSYYVDHDDQRGYAMGDLVLLSDRTLARDWFEKYQDVVFRG